MTTVRVVLHALLLISLTASAAQNGLPLDTPISQGQHILHACASLSYNHTQHTKMPVIMNQKGVLPVLRDPGTVQSQAYAAWLNLTGEPPVLRDSGVAQGQAFDAWPILLDVAPVLRDPGVAQGLANCAWPISRHIGGSEYSEFPTFRNSQNDACKQSEGQLNNLNSPYSNLCAMQHSNTDAGPCLTGCSVAKVRALSTYAFEGQKELRTTGVSKTAPKAGGRFQVWQDSYPLVPANTAAQLTVQHLSLTGISSTAPLKNPTAPLTRICVMGYSNSCRPQDLKAAALATAPDCEITVQLNSRLHIEPDLAAVNSYMIWISNGPQRQMHEILISLEDPTSALCSFPVYKTQRSKITTVKGHRPWAVCIPPQMDKQLVKDRTIPYYVTFPEQVDKSAPTDLTLRVKHSLRQYHRQRYLQLTQKEGQTAEEAFQDPSIMLTEFSGIRSTPKEAVVDITWTHGLLASDSNTTAITLTDQGQITMILTPTDISQTQHGREHSTQIMLNYPAQIEEQHMAELIHEIAKMGSEEADRLVADPYR